MNAKGQKKTAESNEATRSTHTRNGEVSLPPDKSTYSTPEKTTQ